MAGSEPDEVLVRRAVDGDQGAFTELVRRHEGRVFAVALRMLGREEDALDATQDAFLTVYRKSGQFRGESRIRHGGSEGADRASAHGRAGA